MTHSWKKPGVPGTISGSVTGFVLAWTVQLAQCSLKVLNFPFIVNLLPFRKFQGFEHFFHFVERVFEFFNHSIYLLDGVANGGGSSWGLGFLRFLSFFKRRRR